MSKIKIACPDCGQKVSGDESFLGTTVNCPICKTAIDFPKEMPGDAPAEKSDKSAKAKKPEAQEAPASRGSSSKESKENLPLATEPEPATASKSGPKVAPKVASPKTADPAKGPALSPVIPNSGAPGARRKKAPAKTSRAAVLSMISGVAALTLCPIGILFAIPAILAGHSARSAIRSSLGRLSGQNLASTGMVLGYLYVAILFLVILSPWKAFVSFGEQQRNSQNARTILTALTSYASDNGDEFPQAISDLVPKYLAEERFKSSRYIEPGTLPPERLDYEYFSGNKSGEDPRTILLSAPDSDRNYRRLVGYLDGSVDVISEEEFIRRTMKK